jgi:RimJ/RimL family protein N-acetyltransferase
MVQNRSPFLESGSVAIFPLTVSELSLWLTDPAALEAELGTRLVMGRPNRLMTAVFERKVAKIHADPTGWLWATYWAIVIEHRELVGLVGFKGRAGEEAEVGYGIEKEYRGRGIMKKALELILTWAEQQPCISRVAARTDSENEASIRVLRACDFAIAGRRGHEIRWIRNV